MSQPDCRDASVQTELDVDDRGTQIPECDVASPKKFDHQYASCAPDNPSLFEIDLHSLLQVCLTYQIDFCIFYASSAEGECWRHYGLGLSTFPNFLSS